MEQYIPHFLEMEQYIPHSLEMEQYIPHFLEMEQCIPYPLTCHLLSRNIETNTVNIQGLFIYISNPICMQTVSVRTYSILHVNMFLNFC